MGGGSGFGHFPATSRHVCICCCVGWLAGSLKSTPTNAHPAKLEPRYSPSHIEDTFIMARSLSIYDAFAKPVDGIRERSVAGGYITLLALASAFLLLLSRVIVQLQVTTRHSMHLADSVPSLLFDKLVGHGKNDKVKALVGHHIPLRLHVTFPHLDCANLDYGHDGNTMSSGTFGHYHKTPYAFSTRKPTSREYLQATVPGYDRDDDNGGGAAAGGKKMEKKKKKSGAGADAVVDVDRSGGCTLLGTLHVPRVGGTLSVSVSPDAWRRATSMLAFGADLFGGPGGGGGGATKPPDPFAGRLPNVTHYVHDLTFGAPFPPGINPLAGAHHVMDNGSGVALASVSVKLVPTTYVVTFRAPRETYQASVSRHIVQPETLASQRSTMLPGLLVTYDFTPLAVRHVESRENWLVFLSSMIGIVGGVFVSVSAVSGCLVDSVQAVAKKMD